METQKKSSLYQTAHSLIEELNKIDQTRQYFIPKNPKYYSIPKQYYSVDRNTGEVYRVPSSYNMTQFINYLNFSISRVNLNNRINRQSNKYNRIAEILAVPIAGYNSEETGENIITEYDTPSIKSNEDIKIEIINRITIINWNNKNKDSTKYFEHQAKYLLTAQKFEYKIHDDYLIISKFIFPNCVYIISIASDPSAPDSNPIYELANIEEYKDMWADTLLIARENVTEKDPLKYYVQRASQTYNTNYDTFTNANNAYHAGYENINMSINFIRTNKKIKLGQNNAKFEKFLNSIDLKTAPKYKNCLLNIIYSETQNNTHSKTELQKLDKYFATITNNFENGINGAYLQDIAKRLKIELHLFSLYGYNTKIPYLIIGANLQHSKKIKVLTHNGHALRFTPDIETTNIIYFDTLTPEQIQALKISPDTIINSNSLKHDATPQSSEYLINCETLYKQFRPSLYINDLPDIDTQKKFKYCNDLETLQFAYFKHTNKIKKTKQYSAQYKASITPLIRYKLNTDAKNANNFIQIDHNSSYLAAKHSPYYKGFPTNANSIMMTITNDYYETIKNKVSLVYVNIHSINRHNNIINNVLKNSRNLWLSYPVFETIKPFITYELSHAITEHFTPDFKLEEFKDEYKKLFNSNSPKLQMLKILGRLIQGGIKQDAETYEDIFNINERITNLNRVDTDIIIDELNRDQMKFTEYTIDHDKDISEIRYEKRQSLQYVHISTFIYGYSVSQILNMLFKLTDNNIPIIGGIVDSVYIATQDNLIKNDSADTLLNDYLAILDTTPQNTNAGPTVDTIINIVKSQIGPNVGQFKIQHLSSLKVAQLIESDINDTKKDQKQPNKSELLKNINPDSKITILNIPAGIGKNYSVYNHMPENSIVLAPTNSRKYQIIEELKNTNLKYLKNISVMTIHKFIKRGIYKSGHKQLIGIDKLQKIKPQSIKYYTHLIIDEFSLSSQTLINEALRIAANHKIYILGDLMQCTIADEELKIIDEKYLNSLNAEIITKYTRTNSMRHNLEFGAFLDSQRVNTYTPPKPKKKSILDPSTLRINGARDANTTEILDNFNKKYKPKKVTLADLCDVETFKKHNIEYNNFIVISGAHKINATINKMYFDYQKEHKKPIYYRTAQGYKYMTYDEYKDETILIKESFNDDKTKKYMAFAGTIHAAQGTTIPQGIKLILDVESLGKNHKAAYTALTRIADHNNIILLYRDEFTM